MLIDYSSTVGRLTQHQEKSSVAEKFIYLIVCTLRPNPSVPNVRLAYTSIRPIERMNDFLFISPKMRFLKK